jgi:hypothetical protein
MDSRSSRFWVILLASVLAWATLIGAGVVRAANSLPLADAWSITSAGTATSSGELLFRVSPADGHDPVEVTVFVLSGSNETGVASSIRRALSAQLDRGRFDVETGEGANVLVRGGAGRGFTIELVDSDVDDVRVRVQSAMPAAPPPVPEQAIPATVPSAPPAQPGEPAPPSAIPPAPTADPPSPRADPSVPPPVPPVESSPADDGAGAPASAPPPSPGPGGS